MSIKSNIRNLALACGIEMNWYNATHSPTARLFTSLSYNNVKNIIDVGANSGGYGHALRAGGYCGNILSFEPLYEAHQKLQDSAANDSNWHVASRMALGSEDGVVEINVSENSVSSSILNIHETHVNAAEHSRFINVQKTTLKRLDHVDLSCLQNDSPLFLKIDTQGYEMPVLQGAEGVFNRIIGLQIELSLVPLYENQLLYVEIIAWLNERGYELWNIIPGFSDSKYGRMLQMDGIFFRR